MRHSANQGQGSEFWSNHISQAYSHSDGVQAYCQTNDLCVQTFYSWKRRLRANSPKRVSVTTNPFLPVKVESPTTTKMSGLPDAKWVAEFILHLQTGLK